jgi:Flp pilus assembly protein TadD
MGEAQEETSRLLALHPKDARGHNLRGILCTAMKDRSCARSAFETSIRLNPRDASVHANLGNIHLELGNREDADAYFSEAVALDPTAVKAKEALRTLGTP